MSFNGTYTKKCSCRELTVVIQGKTPQRETESNYNVLEEFTKCVSTTVDGGRPALTLSMPALHKYVNHTRSRLVWALAAQSSLQAQKAHLWPQPSSHADCRGAKPPSTGWHRLSVILASWHLCTGSGSVTMCCETHLLPQASPWC